MSLESAGNVVKSFFRPEWLTIEGYDDKKRKNKVDSFEAMFNPESVKIELKNKYSTKGGIGRTKNTKFAQPGNSKVKFKLILSKTGVEQNMAANSSRGFHALNTLLPGAAGVESAINAGIARDIERFLSITMMVSAEEHRPRHLILRWGTTLLDTNKMVKNNDVSKTSFERKYAWTGTNQKNAYSCVLESVNVNYTLFDRLGNPLRAELDTVFIEDSSDEPKGGYLESPDVTHARTVNAGDSLPLKAQEIYEEPSYYVQVAEANGLDSVRNIQPGDSLLFPPIAK